MIKPTYLHPRIKTKQNKNNKLEVTAKLEPINKTIAKPEKKKTKKHFQMFTCSLRSILGQKEWQSQKAGDHGLGKDHQEALRDGADAAVGV